MLVLKRNCEPKNTCTIHDVQSVDSLRVPTNFRPVLRVAAEQQIQQMSVPARVLILQAELLLGITFKGRPAARRRAAENARLLAAAVIGYGC